MFAIIFFWTPPHFWALALLIREDYARARIPMLPVVKGVEATRRSILIYTVVVVAITILLFVTSHAVSWIYLGAAIVLGAIFLYLAWRLANSVQRASKTGGRHSERVLYAYSLVYLGLIFVAIMVDSLVGISR